MEQPNHHLKIGHGLATYSVIVTIHDYVHLETKPHPEAVVLMVIHNNGIIRPKAAPPSMVLRLCNVIPQPCFLLDLFVTVT